MPSPDSPISLNDVETVLGQMGYRLVKEEDELRHYSYGDPPVAVTLDFREMLTCGDLERALVVNGINLDAFYAFLKSL